MYRRSGSKALIMYVGAAIGRPQTAANQFFSGRAMLGSIVRASPNTGMSKKKK
jgi:hypothetical protein